MPDNDLVVRRNDEEVIVPVPVEQAAEQGEVAGNLFKFPMFGSGLFPCDILEGTIGFDAHFDKGDLRIVFLGIAEFFPEELGVVFAVFFDELFVGHVHAGLVGDAELFEFVGHFVALDPSGGLEIGSGVGVKIFPVALAAPHEEGDAVVCARQHKLDVARMDSVQTIVAEAVAEQDGVVVLFRGGIDLRLDAPGHFVGWDVVQPLLQKLHVDFMGRLLQKELHLPEEYFATD